MKVETFSLKTILSTFYRVKNKQAKKRYIFNRSSLGALGSTWLKVIFIILPFVAYAAVFNEASFSYLGIAQAVDVFIILMVAIMQIIFLVSYFNNKRAVKSVQKSWRSIFPTVELEYVLSSGATPYKDFLLYYNKALKEGLSDDALETRLKEDFLTMQNENKDLYESMNRK